MLSVLRTLRSNSTHNTHLLAPHVMMRVIGHIWGDDSSVRLESTLETQINSSGARNTRLNHRGRCLEAERAASQPPLDSQISLMQPRQCRISHLWASYWSGRHCSIPGKREECWVLIRMAFMAQLVPDGRDNEDGGKTTECRPEFSLEVDGETRADRSLFVVDIVLGYPHYLDIPVSN